MGGRVLLSVEIFNIVRMVSATIVSVHQVQQLVEMDRSSFANPTVSGGIHNLVEVAKPVLLEATVVLQQPVLKV